MPTPGDVKVRITADTSEVRRDLLHIDRALGDIEPRLRRLYAAAFWQGWCAAAAVVTLAGIVERLA